MEQHCAEIKNRYDAIFVYMLGLQCVVVIAVFALGLDFMNKAYAALDEIVCTVREYACCDDVEDEAEDDYVDQEDPSGTSGDDDEEESKED